MVTIHINHLRTNISRMSESENKELVKKALKAAFVERDISALDRYWGTPYVQHNPIRVGF